MVGAELSRVLQSTSKTVGCILSLHFALEERKFVPALSLSYTSALLFIWMIIVFGGGLCCDYCCVQHFRFLSVFTGG